MNEKKKYNNYKDNPIDLCRDCNKFGCHIHYDEGLNEYCENGSNFKRKNFIMICKNDKLPCSDNMINCDACSRRADEAIRHEKLEFTEAEEKELDALIDSLRLKVEDKSFFDFVVLMQFDLPKRIRSKLIRNVQEHLGVKIMPNEKHLKKNMPTKCKICDAKFDIKDAVNIRISTDIRVVGSYAYVEMRGICPKCNNDKTLREKIEPILKNEYSNNCSITKIERIL